MIHMLDWKTEINTSAAFQEKLKYVSELFKTNAELRNDIYSSSASGLESLARKKRITEREYDLDEAAQYLLEEMAFLLASSSICKSENITDVYHRPWPVWNKFASGYYDGNVATCGNVVIA